MAVEQEELSWTPEARIYRFPARQRRPQPRLRAAIAGAVVVAIVVAAGRGSAASPPPTPRPRSGVVVVASGDTLWEIAVRYAPRGSDPRVFIDAVQDLNSLSGPPVAGMRLRLPK